MYSYETTLELAGESLPAIIGYETDPLNDEGQSAADICISSVILRRCVKQRGDIAYLPDGDAYQVTFPEYIELDIFQLLGGSQLKELAEEIYESLEENNWHDVMNEPRSYGPRLPRNFPDNFPGVRLQ